jgi:dTDP-4-dehydrorhamnose reductase
MKVLVLGGDGMLGHQVARRLASSHEVIATVRKPPATIVTAALMGCRVISGVDARLPGSLKLVEETEADLVVNAVGIVKQRAAAADPVESITVNSLFPHQLADACRKANSRLIHISTDCVFSGARGDYREEDTPDPGDLYGLTKLLGEVSLPGSLTLRTSMIGLELANHSSLVEWFLRQPVEVRGYRKAIWNGLTTVELARVVARLATEQPELHGLWHVSGESISKFDLLGRLAVMLGRHVAMVPDDKVVIDRSLNSERFRAAVGYEPPSMDAMLSELATAVRAREEESVA